MSFADLRNNALRVAEMRRHTMGHWKELAPGNSVCSCKVCGKEMQVLSRPAPNESEISGAAVGMSCLPPAVKWHN